MKIKSDSPGPGAYNSESTIAYKTSPCFSISGRHKLKDPGTTPGPGAYSVDTSHSSPAFSLSGRPDSRLKT